MRAVGGILHQEPQVGDEDDPAGRFDDEDDPLLLRLCQLKRGGLLPSGGEEMIWEHVAIDEAQDRSALEVKVLVEAVRAPDSDPGKRSVTIAGDTAQRLVFDNNFTGWAELLEQTGQPAIVRPLRLSYRSTAEVMLLAREIKSLVGVVEHGIFIGLAHRIIVAGADGVEVHERAADA